MKNNFIDFLFAVSENEAVTFKGKNLLLFKQILSFKSNSFILLKQILSFKSNIFILKQILSFKSNSFILLKQILSFKVSIVLLVIKRFNTNHYEKRFSFHVWCSNVACCAAIEYYTQQKVEGIVFGNDRSLQQILLCFAGFPFSNVT